MDLASRGGLTASWLAWWDSPVMSVVTEATITCPRCGHTERESMPLDACRYVYECRGCGTRLLPLAGDCCVFCSYADTPCPPRQTA